MKNQIPSVLQKSHIQFLRLVWCDNANVIRAKAIHTGRVREYSKHGVGISEAQQAVPVMYDAPCDGSGLGPVGEVRLVPDWSTLNILPYAPTHARVLGDMIKNGHNWSCCPRFFLKRAIAAANSHNIQIKAAFENEFYLLNTDGTSVDNTLFASTTAMDAQHEVIDDMASALIVQAVPVEQYYAESGPGQQEISVLYRDALGAADQQIVFRETIRAVAKKHNLLASFLPKIFPQQAGSGCHLHMSLWEENDNITYNPEMPGELSPYAKSFMAGILKHLPSLMAITTPSTNSYRRIIPHSWSGAFSCWGWDNREAAIRVPTNPEFPSPTNFELKTVDATANPYIALGAVIFAGLDGISSNLQLPKEIEVDPGTLTDAKRQSRGITRLPINLGEAIQNLENDQVLLDALHPDLARTYLAVKKTEWEVMKEWELEQEVKLLLERY